MKICKVCVIVWEKCVRIRGLEEEKKKKKKNEPTFSHFSAFKRSIENAARKYGFELTFLNSHFLL